MSPQKEQFIAWLNDAYSTELALMPVLKNHAADAEEYETGDDSVEEATLELTEEDLRTLQKMKIKF